MSTSIQLPVPKSTWDRALHERSITKCNTKWRLSPPSHFGKVWRDKFSKEIIGLNRNGLRKVTQFLTGHAVVNYHLNKFKPGKISKTCPYCFDSDETIDHYMGRCPMWSYQRCTFFGSFSLNVTDISDNHTLSVILQFINTTKRMSASSLK